jgi:PBP1b-binding outer membrane lipoprotein LpoB
MVFMKKIAVILAICFIAALFLSSCNEKTCPAYSKAETSQTDNNG